MKNLTKTKSKIEEVAIFMLNSGKHFTTITLMKDLNISVKDANNHLFSVKKSGRYTIDEKKIDGRVAIKVTEVKTPNHSNAKKGWHYSDQEVRERLIWDMATFGIEPVRNKAFELEAA
jgi:hypothetical protein